MTNWTLYSFLSLYQTTPQNISSSNTSSICDKRLFQLGDLSAEGHNATMTNNICPDSIFTPIFSALFLALYLIFVVVGLAGIIWKRDSGHIRARNPLYMVVTILASLYFMLSSCLRFIVGRKIFPCFLYTISFFITVPAVCLPSLFSFSRIYFMYRLNLRKAATFDSKHSKNKNGTIAAATHVELKNSSNNNGTIELKNSSTSNHDSSTTSSKEASFTTSSNRIEQTKIVDTNGNNTPHEIDHYSTTNGQVSLKIDPETDTNDGGESWVTSTDLDFTEAVYNDKVFKIYSFLLSYKLIVVVYIVVFILHILIWAIFGGADDLNVKNGGKRVFLWYISMFAADTGCVTNTNTVILLASEGALYIVIEIIFLIPLFFADRDVYHIKRDTVVLIIFQIVTALSFVISGQIDVVRFLTDFFVPFGYTLLTYCLIEIFIAVILPICYAIIHDRKLQKQNENYSQSDIELVLKNRKAFEMLLNYARRCYCPEDILAFRDIEKFKKISKKHRKQVAEKILKTYLKIGSSLELNVPELAKKYDEIELVLNQAQKGSSIPLTLFDEVLVVCLSNMIDVFERLKSTDKNFQELVKKNVVNKQHDVVNKD